MTVNHPIEPADTPHAGSPRRRRDLPSSTPGERKEQQHQARTRYLAGDSIRDIARHLDRSYGYARKLLLDEGVELRASGRQPRTCQDSDQ
jgi:hypothetical protein